MRAVSHSSFGFFYWYTRSLSLDPPACVSNHPGLRLWKQRWFALQGSYLAYYATSDTSRDPICTIHLRHTVVVPKEDRGIALHVGHGEIHIVLEYSDVVM